MVIGFNFKNDILFFPDPDATNVVNSIKKVLNLILHL